MRNQEFESDSNQDRNSSEIIENVPVDGIGGETIAIFTLSFILILVLIPYQIVSLNTVYTHTHLEVKDVPYYEATLDSGSEMASRYASIDYYVQWSDILLWILPITAVFSLYHIMVNRYNMVWLYTTVAFFIMLITWLKFFYIIFLFLACKRSAFCTSENPDSARGISNSTFIWRLIANLLFSFITTLFTILAHPLSKLQNQTKLLSVKPKKM